MTRSSASVSPVAPVNGHAAVPMAEVRNPGLPLDLDWVHEARFTNRSAAERRAATLPARRSVKKKRGKPHGYRYLR
jgi:deoxyribose-phosphate aldolase